MEQKEQQQSMPSLSNEQRNSLLFINEWLINDKERNERQKYIDEAKQYWIDNRTVKANYFENRIVKPWLEIIPDLQPITIEMIEDYMTGIVFLPSAMKDEKLQPVVNRLIKPTLDKIAEIMFSDVHRNYVIDKIVDEKATIKVKMFPKGSDTDSTRKALKGYIKDKTIYPLESKLNELKVKFKLHQEKEFKHLYIALGGKDETPKAKDENPHPEIFKDLESWNLFEKFMQQSEQRKIIREESFIYRMMCENEKPALIHRHIKPGMFKEWFNENMTSEYEPLSEVKTFNDSTIKLRLNNYKSIKALCFNKNNPKIDIV